MCILCLFRICSGLFCCSARTGEGIVDGVSWLCEQLTLRDGGGCGMCGTDCGTAQSVAGHRLRICCEGMMRCGVEDPPSAVPETSGSLSMRPRQAVPTEKQQQQAISAVARRSSAVRAVQEDIVAKSHAHEETQQAPGSDPNSADTITDVQAQFKGDKKETGESQKEEQNQKPGSVRQATVGGDRLESESRRQRIPSHTAWTSARDA
eukprot:GHVT01056015.1.p1 GENE.GHVT01056015.1~~GHVT01056015.1.p1  ORF type:complete len:207 (+),score=31.59 GHVT01056015.1:1360-1980(+)